MIQIQELLVLRQRAVADFPSWLPAIWAHKQSELPRSHRMHWSYWDAQELLKNTQNSGTDPAESNLHLPTHATDLYENPVLAELDS